MTFEYRDAYGRVLTADHGLDDDDNPMAVLWARGEFGASVPVRIPADRVEEVIAGIRDAARQASGHQPDSAISGWTAASERAYTPVPLTGIRIDRCATITVPAAEAPTHRQYPQQDGDVTVLGPEIFASADEQVISWRGRNYVPQPDPAAAARTPCSGLVPCEDGGEPCDQHEREQAHAEGEHAFCGDECAAGLSDTQPANDEAEFTEARAAFMQIGQTPALQNLRVELRIEGYPTLVGNYAGAGMRRLEEGVLAIEPLLLFAWADTSTVEEDETR